MCARPRKLIKIWGISSMQKLLDRIRQDGEYVGDGIIKLDGFLNHQVDPQLTQEMGEEFAKQFGLLGVSTVNKVVTAEVSGIPSALITAFILNVPLVYARKHRSAVMTDVYYMAQAQSRTKSNNVDLMISRKYLSADDSVLVIDDFLATGSTLSALCSIIVESGAQIQGIGCVIEKPQENGRQVLAQYNAPIVTLAKITWKDDELFLSS